MITTTISDFRANVKMYVDKVINGANSVLINRGNTAAVLISLEEYNSIKETERISSSTAVSDLLVSSINEWKSGKTIEVNIDEL